MEKSELSEEFLSYFKDNEQDGEIECLVETLSDKFIKTSTGKRTITIFNMKDGRKRARMLNKEYGYKRVPIKIIKLEKNLLEVVSKVSWENKYDDRIFGFTVTTSQPEICIINNTVWRKVQ